MPRLFGTDGIRGVANVDLKPTLAYALGRATAHELAGAGATIVVGQDTRRSGDMFVAAIIAGATSLGVDVHVAGCVPTPALAFLAGSGDFAAGIMVSASHNPADDNGLKVLDRSGLKLDDAIEAGSSSSSGAPRSSATSATPRSAGGWSLLISSIDTAIIGSAWPARSRRAGCGSSSTVRTARAGWSARRSSRRPARLSR